MQIYNEIICFLQNGNAVIVYQVLFIFVPWFGLLFAEIILLVKIMRRFAAENSDPD